MKKAAMLLSMLTIIAFIGFASRRGDTARSARALDARLWQAETKHLAQLEAHLVAHSGLRPYLRSLCIETGKINNHPEKGFELLERIKQAVKKGDLKIAIFDIPIVPILLARAKHIWFTANEDHSR